MNDMKDDKALVHLGPRAFDMNLFLPVRLTDAEAMRAGIPLASAYRNKVQNLRRVGIPKSVYDTLGLTAGDEVDVIIRPVKSSVKDVEET